METSINEDMEGEDISFFGERSGTIQEHLLSNYKDNYTSLIDKDPVTYSSKLKPTEVIDVVISESNIFFHKSLSMAMSYKTINLRDMI